MTRAKAVDYVVTLLAVLASIITAATFQPRPSDRHSMTPSAAAPSPDRNLRPRTDQRYTVLAGELDERVRAGDLGEGGQLLDPVGLARLISRTPTAVRHALEQLARTGTVEPLGRQWCIPDDHATPRAARRARHLLEAMIDAGGYPPHTALPPAPHLVETLLTHPDALARALQTLTSSHILEPVRQGFAVRAPEEGRGSSALPPRGGRAILLGPDTAWNRDAIRHLRDLARKQWHHAPCPSHHVISRVETLQHDILHRLMLAADRQHPSPGRNAAVQAAIARATAARDTTVISLGERHWRSAVLAGLLADLADSLSSARP
ncbi:hypothetical protein ACFV6B_03665 [Streptomyces microflavus]|uniref:hypothetical protein n=1 Tax=Streptomyces microflavus TaxID=1919 RepID=UPI00364A6DAB